MSYRGVLPIGEGEFRTNGGGRSSIVASMLPPPSSVPLLDEVESLLREKLDLHSELFEAAQIQRKLSGPREFRHGSLQFAREVFAARFLSGDFTTFLKSGSKVLMAHDWARLNSASRLSARAGLAVPRSASLSVLKQAERASL